MSKSAKNKMLIICGPTATGKTELGIRLAKKFNGEIVSADSRQVYKGMDIGTGKDIQNGKWKMENGKNGHWEIKGIPIWMLDVVEPNREFNVARYVALARKVIEEIWERKKLPIIVGGTGFYIKAVLDGIGTLGIPPNWSLRLRLNKLSVNELFEILGHMDSLKAASLNASDRKNSRRLIRAIEVAQARGVPEKQFSNLIRRPADQFSILMIGLVAPYEFLYQTIDERINGWVKMGAEEEIKKLLKNYRWETSVLSETLGYKEWRPYFEDKITFDEAIRRWKFDEHAYARRQMTWFKKALRLAQGYWFDISQGGWENKIEKLVSFWYTKT